MSQRDKQSMFESWMLEISREHPDCNTRETRAGCAVFNEDNELVIEYDYEPDPHVEQRVRY